MTRREAVVVILIAIGMIATGLAALFGPWGLIGSGVGLLAVPLLSHEAKEGDAE